MALQILTVTDSISRLTVDDVVFCDIDEIPPDVLVLRQKMFFPEPSNFITDFSVERNSYGAGSALMTVHYTLHYKYCHVPLGEGRTGLAVYSELVEKWAAIVDEFLALDDITGSVDFTLPSGVEFGSVVDPSGNEFFGFEFQIYIQEFVN